MITPPKKKVIWSNCWKR